MKSFPILQKKFIIKAFDLWLFEMKAEGVTIFHKHYLGCRLVALSQITL